LISTRNPISLAGTARKASIAIDSLFGAAIACLASTAGRSRPGLGLGSNPGAALVMPPECVATQVSHRAVCGFRTLSLP
jgi:hypothetical protein